MAVCPKDVDYNTWLLTAIWNRGGWVGVDLFFVLSGFLVSGLLFREFGKTQALNLRVFLIRRALKIYPAFWIFIAVTVSFGSGGSGRTLNSMNLVSELLFIQNYSPGMWIHTWSLAVEEHFYILLCVVFWFLIGREAHLGLRLVPFVVYVLR